MEQGDIVEGERFGMAALHLMAIMARLFGWRPDEFWQATPAEVAAVLTPLASDLPSAGPAGGWSGRPGGNWADGREWLAALMERYPDG